MAKGFLHHHRSVSRLQAVSAGASMHLPPEGATGVMARGNHGQEIFQDDLERLGMGHYTRAT